MVSPPFVIQRLTIYGNSIDVKLRASCILVSRNPRDDVLVIGCGVIGVACAYYLSKEGLRVRLLEKDRIGSGASHANCGLLSPSQALPLATPGVIGKGLRWLLRKDSPLFIKARFDPALMMWLGRFALRCNDRDMRASIDALCPILSGSRALYERLFQEESMACEWSPSGSLSVFRTEKEMAAFAPTVELLKARGIVAVALTDAALREKEPAVRDDMFGGWYFKIDAHLRPDRLMAEWRRILLECGVAVEEDCAVRSLDVPGGSVRSAGTARGRFAADHFVLAAGAWSPRLARRLGVKLPIQPAKGYSVTMGRPARCPRMPVFFQETKVLATPWPSGFRLGGTMEFSGFDPAKSSIRISALHRAAAEYLHDPGNGPAGEEWAGWRPMTWDSLPVIDRPPPLP